MNSQWHDVVMRALVAVIFIIIVIAVLVYNDRKNSLILQAIQTGHDPARVSTAFDNR